MVQSLVSWSIDSGYHAMDRIIVMSPRVKNVSLQYLSSDAPGVQRSTVMDSVLAPGK